MMTYVLVMTVTLLGHTGDVLPKGQQFRYAGPDAERCEAARVRLVRHFKRHPPPLTPDKIHCIEVK